nr:SDR family NAD(P)-dependent oxidoreductase [uncultured Lacibacter sp.]
MKKVVIIGASSGIGKALAICYLKAGHKVGITGRRKHLLEELKQQYPQQVSVETFDVTGPDNLLHLKQLIEQLGGMDVFVYSSGTGEASKSLSDEIEQQTTLINVNGFVENTVYAFNYFLQQGYGQVVGISSIAAYRGNSWAPAYGASKAYMSNYLEALSIKASRMKIPITITDIQPGFVQTEMAKGNKLFWMAPLDKAVKQIFNAIEKKKRKVQVTKRWALIAWVLTWLPYSIYKKLN